jgi:CBS domain-containing protein
MILSGAYALHCAAYRQNIAQFTSAVDENMYIVGFDAKTTMWNPITCLPEQTLMDARRLMMKYNISRVIIAKRGKPLGIVTEKDIARSLYQKVPSRRLDEIRLDEVMSRHLVRVEPNEDLKICAKIMLQKGVSSMIVTENNDALKGIFTKTDLVSAYVEYFALTHKVKEFMISNVITIKLDEPVHSALLLMSQNNISRVIVTDRPGHPVGIITGRDLLTIGAYLAYEGQKTKKNYLPFIPSGIKAFTVASDIMKEKLITTTPDSDLADAAYVMLRNRISGLPVVNPKGILTGIITKTDVVRALASHA